MIFVSKYYEHRVAAFSLIGKRERANLVVQTARFYTTAYVVYVRIRGFVLLLLLYNLH